MNLTYKEGLAIARENSLEDEYNKAIDNGFTPYEALEDWDMLEYYENID